MTLAEVGPFTFIGECTKEGEYVYAGTFVHTSQERSAIDSFHVIESTDWGPATTGTTHNASEAEVAGRFAIGFYTGARPTERTFGGPDDGSTSGVSGDGATWFNAFTTTGVNVAQTTEAQPCLFQGHIDSPSIG